MLRKGRHLALVWVVLGACAAVFAAGARADTWKLDPDHTEIRFSWNHLGLSRQSGEFINPSGRLKFAPTDPERAKVEVSVRLKDLRTGVAALDRALRLPDYFDSASHTRVSFESTAVRKTGPKSGKIDGLLTIRGRSRPITFDTIWNFTGEHPLSSFNPIYRNRWVSGFSARSRIRRSEWGMTQAIPLVSDEIQIEIEAEFLRVD